MSLRVAGSFVNRVTCQIWSHFKVSNLVRLLPCFKWTVFPLSSDENSIFCKYIRNINFPQRLCHPPTEWKPLFTSLMLTRYVERDHLYFLMFQVGRDKCIVFLLYYQKQMKKLTHLISKTMAHFMGYLWDNRIRILAVNIILYSVRSSAFCMMVRMLTNIPK